jgi:hypothetical protein
MEAPATAAPAWRWDRYAPLTGIAAVVFWIVGVIVEGQRPDTDEPQELVAWFQDDPGRIMAGGFIFVLGCLLFIWFIGSLASAFRAVEGLPGRLSSLVFGGGIMVGLALVINGGATVQAAFEEDNLTPSTAQSLSFAGDMFFGVAEVVGIVLMIATALAILRTRTFPTWLAWLSLLLALVLVIIPIGWAGVVWGYPLWTLITSFLLYRRLATTTL